MNCQLIRYLLELRRGASGQEFRDAEKTIGSHLAECAECRAIADRENRFEQILLSRIKQVEIPAEFGARLLDRLNLNAVPKKKRFRALKRGALLAACALVLGLLGFGAFQKYWPKPVTDNSWNHFWDDSFSWEYSPPDRDQVTSWFSAMGIQTDLPAEVNYQHLVSHGLVLWDGKLVPQLVFANPSTNGGRPAIAKVLVVSSRQFRLESLFPLPLNQEGSRSKVDCLPESNDRSLFLVSHAGDRLDWLLTTTVSANIEPR